jgi:hypothetical protein
VKYSVRSRKILRGCGVVARGSISYGVIFCSLEGVVLGRFVKIFSSFGGVSWSLGVVTEAEYYLGVTVWQVKAAYVVVYNFGALVV